MRLGIALRKFASTTCEAYETRDLPSEESARGRRKAALSAKKKGVQKNTSTKKSVKKCMFNLSSYKLHSLPDYATSIRMYGTTDNYTTQAVCVCNLKLCKKTNTVPGGTRTSASQAPILKGTQGQVHCGYCKTNPA